MASCRGNFRFGCSSFVCAVALLSLPGCGTRQGPERAAVEGQVTLDGKPVEQGAISFAPSGETQGMTAGGAITNGRFRIESDRGPVVGTNQVRINASAKTGRKVQAPMSEPGVLTDEIVEAVPARFNSKSTLTRELKAGENRLDFELSSR